MLYDGSDGVMTDSNGLYYLRARYYSPELMRFLNTDPLKGTIKDSRTLNSYAYANGNPISLIDPFGTSAEHRKQNSSRRRNQSPNITTRNGGKDEDEEDDDCASTMILGQEIYTGYKNYYYRWDKYDTRSGSFKKMDDMHVIRGKGGDDKEFDCEWADGEVKHKGKPWPKKVREKLKEKGWPPKLKSSKPSKDEAVAEPNSSQFDYLGAGAKALGCAVVLAVLIADDATGIGVVDDTLIPIVGAEFVALITNYKKCRAFNCHTVNTYGY